METNQRLEYIVSTLLRFRKLWIYPAIAGLLLAAVYAFFLKSDSWSAKQALIVRDDLLGQSFKPGQFSSLESMKSAQETILEIARKPQVIHNTLAQLGPPKSGMFAGSDAGWPSEKTVEQIQGAISFSAPNGAEFGKTEVIVLNTKAATRERSEQFINILLNEIDKKISEVRSLRLQSMESELSQARDATALSLERSREKFREMANQLGADVGTMNGLTSQQAGGENGVERNLHQIGIEKRAFQAELASVLNSQQLLKSAKSNPEQILAMSSNFLNSQPRLQALQKSLVDAQQVYASTVGRYQPGHPLVKSSYETIDAMRNQIFQELESLTKSVDAQVDELRAKISRLDELEQSGTSKLANLGSKQIDHLTINAEITKKTELFNNTQAQLAEVQALRIASGQVEWLTRVDTPQVATRPDGMGKKATILAGAICGLMMGLGLVMLIAPPMEEPQHGRPGRRTDVTQRLTKSNQAAPKLDEIVGPTAASAIHSASAATAATVSKGVSFAKSAFGKSGSDSTNSPAASEPSSPISIPHMSQLDVDDPAQTITEQPVIKPAPRAIPVSVTAAVANSASVTASPAAIVRPVRAKAIEISPVIIQPRYSSTQAEVPAFKHAEPIIQLDEVSAFVEPAANITKPTIELTPAAPIAAAEIPQTDPITVVPSAAEILAQIRAKVDAKNKSKSDANANSNLPQSTEIPVAKSEVNTNAARQRAGNVRPIDLAKSADNRSASFVKISPRDEAATQQIDNFMASNMNLDHAESGGVPLPIAVDQPAKHTMEKVTPDYIAKQIPEFAENPFLKNLPTRKIQLDQPPTNPPVRPSNETPRSGSGSLPLPDQIKNLANSIARFANPIQPPKLDGGSDD